MTSLDKSEQEHDPSSVLRKEDWEDSTFELRNCSGVVKSQFPPLLLWCSKVTGGKKNSSRIWLKSHMNIGCITKGDKDPGPVKPNFPDQALNLLI